MLFCTILRTKVTVAYQMLAGTENELELSAAYISMADILVISGTKYGCSIFTQLYWTWKYVALQLIDSPLGGARKCLFIWVIMNILYGGWAMFLSIFNTWEQPRQDRTWWWQNLNRPMQKLAASEPPEYAALGWWVKLRVMELVLWVVVVAAEL